METVKEVFAEGPRRDHLREVAMGGRDDADVDRLLARRPDWTHDLLLEDAQEAGLHLLRHLSDFVEQQRSLVGFAKESAAIAIGTGAPEPDPASLTHKFAGMAAQFKPRKGRFARGPA